MWILYFPLITQQWNVGNSDLIASGWLMKQDAHSLLESSLEYFQAQKFHSLSEKISPMTTTLPLKMWFSLGNCNLGLVPNLPSLCTFKKIMILYHNPWMAAENTISLSFLRECPLRFSSYIVCSLFQLHSWFNLLISWNATIWKMNSLLVS